MLAAKAEQLQAMKFLESISFLHVLNVLHRTCLQSVSAWIGTKEAADEFRHDHIHLDQLPAIDTRG